MRAGKAFSADFDAIRRESRRTLNILCKSKELAKTHYLCFCLLFGIVINTYVHNPEIQHCHHGLSRKVCDLVKLLICDEIFFYHPRTTTGNNLVKSQIRTQIFPVYTAGRHKMEIYIWSGQSFHHFHTTCLFGRKKLHRIKTCTKRHLYGVCVHAARYYRHSLFHAVIYYL